MCAPVTDPLWRPSTPLSQSTRPSLHGGSACCCCVCWAANTAARSLAHDPPSWRPLACTPIAPRPARCCSPREGAWMACWRLACRLGYPPPPGPPPLLCSSLPPRPWAFPSAPAPRCSDQKQPSAVCSSVCVVGLCSLPRGGALPLPLPPSLSLSCSPPPLSYLCPLSSCRRHGTDGRTMRAPWDPEAGGRAGVRAGLRWAGLCVWSARVCARFGGGNTRGLCR